MGGLMENISSQITWLEQIKVSQLSNRALMLASRIARKIRNTNGVTIKLQSNSIALDLAEQVEAINSPELHALFADFLKEATSYHKPLDEQLDDETEKNKTNLYRGQPVLDKQGADSKGRSSKSKKGGFYRGQKT